MSISLWRAAGVAVALSGAAEARDMIRPAEQPPADYAGLQYVDSKGCLFLRAGTDGNVTWIARVTQQGGAVCGYPPSGNRVPIVGEAGPSVEAGTAPLATGGLLVAVGSFSKASNAAAATQMVESLGLPVVMDETEQSGIPVMSVFAGPFEDETVATAALSAIRTAGFPDAEIIRQ